jgi:hypothetical protein
MSDNNQEFPYASSLKIDEAIITGLDGTEVSIIGLIKSFQYFEDIDMPSISMNLDIVDNAANIISSLPIQGYENVKIVFGGADEELLTLNLKVAKIYNRFSADRYQEYSLGLVSNELLVNESLRLGERLAGKSEGIVTQLMERLGSDKRLISDPSMFKVTFLPGKKTPFSIISSMKERTVPESAKTSSGGSSTTSDLLILKGSAGYYFYENYDGYHFRSIDSLNSVKTNPPVDTFFQENDQINPQNAPRKILDIDFQQEIDILSKLRMGTYSNVICFYNYSTGAYEEYTYNLGDRFDDMEHLGSQSGLAKGQATLAENPSRIMSVLMDHETWFDGVEVASPEDKDGGKKNTTEFPDWQKYVVAQSIARKQSQNNQQVFIQIPFRTDLRVGQTVQIMIPNNIPSSEREENDVFDKEHSGAYLIAKLQHSADALNAKANTYLTLVRDSYGMPDEPSDVATK